MSIRERLESRKGFDERILQLRKTKLEWERDVDSSKEAMIQSGAFDIFEELLLLVPGSDIVERFDKVKKSASLFFTFNERGSVSASGRVVSRNSSHLNLVANSKKEINIEAIYFFSMMSPLDVNRHNNVLFSKPLDETLWGNREEFEKLITLALLKAGLNTESLQK